MDPYQFNDLPQIPEEAGFGNTHLDHFSHFHTYSGIVAPAIPLQGQYSHPHLPKHCQMSASQPLQRFLRDHFAPAFTNGNLERTSAFDHAHGELFRQAQYSTYTLFPERDGSPGVSTSGSSSHGTQNELNSPQAYQLGPFRCSDDIHHDSPSPPFSHDGLYHSEGMAGGICPKVIEYEHHDHAVDEQDNDIKTCLGYEQEPLYPQVSLIETSSEEDCYKSLDSAISGPFQKEESVKPAIFSGDDSDTDYVPPSQKTNRRRHSSGSNTSGRQQKRWVAKASTTAATPTASRVVKRTRTLRTSQGRMRGRTLVKANEQIAARPDARPFPCCLAGYGCKATFTSKNEWKRHMATQHIKLGFWRCNLCVTTVDPHDEHTVYHNDFNRKDLFSQHLRRMHGQSQGSKDRNEKDFPVTEDNLTEHQKHCYMTLRATPPRSSCLFCDAVFEGPMSWDDRMEHVGKHFEKERKPGMLDVTTWKEDKEHEQWLLREGLIIYDGGDGWKIGDGRPRRRDSVLNMTDDP